MFEEIPESKRPRHGSSVDRVGEGDEVPLVN